MFNKIVLTTVSAGIFLGSSMTASALEPVWKFLEAELTPVSGKLGRIQKIELNRSRNQGLRSILIYEDKNRPCKLVLGPKNLYSESTQSENTHAYNDNEANKCKGSPGDLITAGWSDSKSSDQSSRYYIRGIATCASKVAKNRDRIKGIRVVAAKVWETKREVEALATTDIGKQANCDEEWHETVYCDSGRVAVGVNIHWSSENAITGIALRCGYISWLGSS